MDGVRAAVRQVLAHPLLHMSQQLLQTEEESEVNRERSTHLTKAI